MSDSSWRVTVRDTILIIVGCLLFAIGADCFEIPYGLAAGGVTGLATVIYAVTGLPVGLMVGSVEDRVTIQAFLSDTADQTAVDKLQAKIEGWDNVESVTYKSKDEALEEYRNTMSNRNAADAVAALDGENPIPASLVIKLTDPQQVEATATALTSDSDFISVCDDPNNPTSSVQYGRETVEKLFSVTNYLRIGAIVLVALLTFVAFVFINNTIRLAITARRREIAIMAIIPLEMYFDEHNRVKLCIGLARGKKLYDKRDDMARRDVDREIQRALKDRSH